MIEPTFEVEGGTPAQALEYILNRQAEEGYRLRACVPVRGAKDGMADDQAVTVMVLERDEV